MENIKTGFSIVCNWCGHNEILIKPIDSEKCVLECLNTECQETVHFIKLNNE